MKKKPRTWRLVLREMRFNIAVFLLLLSLSAAGLVIVGNALLRNAQDTGRALARSYASEESGNLAVYQTLLSFGAASIDRRLLDGEDPEDMNEWMGLYFQRLDMVLGSGVVDPYVVLDGRILAAATPWEGDSSYDFPSTEWYRRAMESPGFQDGEGPRKTVRRSRICANTHWKSRECSAGCVSPMSTTPSAGRSV